MFDRRALYDRRIKSGNTFYNAGQFFFHVVGLTKLSIFEDRSSLERDRFITRLPVFEDRPFIIWRETNLMEIDR